MRILRLGILVAVGLGVLGVDVGASLRAGTICAHDAYAKRHRKRHRRRVRHRRHRKHHRAPAQEM